MTVIVGSDLEHNTHHISLTDGQVTIGLIATDRNGNKNARAIRRSPMQRTAMKTTSGTQTYSDMNWPWVTTAQESFEGGRGSEDFEKATSRYYSGHRLSIATGKIFNGPMETYMTGLRKEKAYLPGSVYWVALLGQQRHFAAKVIPDDSFTAGRIEIWVRRRGTPTSDLTIRLRDSAGNEPSTILASGTVTINDVTDTISEFRKVVINQALTAGNNYWIEVYCASSDDTNYWQVGVANTATNNKQSSDGSTWTVSSKSLYYRIAEAKTEPIVKFFRYRHMRYMTRQIGTNAPKVWINGDRGMADANTGQLDKLIDATKSWTPDELIGGIVMIVSGKGFDEPQKWRTITGNDGTSLTVSPVWTIEHDTTTEYIVVNVNKWTEIAGHGLTKPITQVFINNNVVYFCQGDDTVIRRMRFNTTTGAHEWADDGTNKAMFLCRVRETTGLMIWRANNKDASGNISISKALAVDWGTNLTFGTAETFKDDYGRITNLIEYGDDTKMLYILREGMIFTHNGTNIDSLGLDELSTIADEANGKAAIVFNRFLIFSMKKRIERYYDRNLEDIGPDRDAGLSDNRQGDCIALLGYPGRYFAAYDAGDIGYSSVLLNTTGEQWHDFYIAPYGERIQSIAFDVIPGTQPDRLIIAQGDDVIWLAMPSGTLDANKDANVRYTHESVLISSYINGGFPDIWKLYYTLKLRTKDLETDEQFIEVDYQVDDDDEWTPINGVFDKSPVSELPINEEYGKNAKQFRYRLRMQTTDNTKTPILKTVVVEMLGLIPVKYGYTIPFRVKDNDVTLLGDLDDITAEQKMKVIDEWAASLTPLYMRCIKKRFDGKRVFINPSPMTPQTENSENYLGDISLVEI